MSAALVRPGAGLLFMKVGVHAQEGLDAIVARKAREIEDEGYAMWGYGGNTCHPRTMVQPFAEMFEERGEPIHLCMDEMDSRHYAEQIRAKQFSADGVAWSDIPAGINVLGSRFALCIEDLRREAFDLPLGRTRVAVGVSRGRVGSEYVQGRADKACLEVVPASELPNDADPRVVGVDLVARLRPPYAVFLRC